MEHHARIFMFWMDFLDIIIIIVVFCAVFFSLPNLGFSTNMTCEKMSLGFMMLEVSIQLLFFLHLDIGCKELLQNFQVFTYLIV